jgi:hypothetical protein
VSRARIKEILYDKCYSFDESLLQYIEARVKGIKNEKEFREKADILVHNYLTLH